MDGYTYNELQHSIREGKEAQSHEHRKESIYLEMCVDSHAVLWIGTEVITSHQVIQVA